MTKLASEEPPFCHLYLQNSVFSYLTLKTTQSGMSHCLPVLCQETEGWTENSICFESSLNWEPMVDDTGD